MTRTRPSSARLVARTSLSERLREQVRLLMKKHKKTYRDLAEGLGVSESTVKRCLHSDDLAIARLEQIAAFLHLDPFDLLDMARAAEVADATLSAEQEAFLAAHPHVAHYYWLILSGCSPLDIAQMKELSEADTNSYLATLESLGVLHRTGDQAISLKASRGLRFNLNGPMQKRYSEAMVKALVTHLLTRVKALNAASPAAGFGFRLTQFLLPRASYQRLLSEVGALITTYEKESRSRLATARADKLEAVSMLVGIDHFDAFTATLGELRKGP